VPRTELHNGPVEYRWTHGPARPGPPLVFLHEGLGCVATWKRFPDTVARASGRSGMLYSRHGYGGSGPAPGRRPVTYLHDEATRVLPELLDRLALAGPLLVGHSDGASIALLHAAEHPVAGLVLMAPHVFVEPETLAGIAAARAAYREGGLARRLAGFHDDAETAFRSWTGVWLSEEFRRWNIEGVLPDVQCPVLLVQGDADQYGTVRQLDAIEAGVAGPTRRVVLPHCGHSPHLEQPAKTCEAMTDFLRDIPAPATGTP
jgi:pimeloyl-ACP methyl ester carboxylesterase